MATAKYGFFFFLLSKGLAQSSGPNGIPNQWMDQQSNGLSADISSYYDYPQNSEFNELFTSNYQEPTEYDQQMIAHSVPEPSYTPQNMYSPSYLDSMQPPVFQNDFERPPLEYGPVDSNGGYDQFQKTDVEYSNGRPYIDEDYDDRSSSIYTTADSPSPVQEFPTLSSQSNYPPTQGRSSQSRQISSVEDFMNPSYQSTITGGQPKFGLSFNNGNNGGVPEDMFSSINPQLLQKNSDQQKPSPPPTQQSYTPPTYQNQPSPTYQNQPSPTYQNQPSPTQQPQPISSQPYPPLNTGGGPLQPLPSVPSESKPQLPFQSQTNQFPSQTNQFPLQANPLSPLKNQPSSTQQSQINLPQSYQPPPKIQGGPQQPLSNAPSTEGSQNQLAKSQIQPLQMEAPRFNVPILNDENPSFKTVNPQLLQSPASPPPAYQNLPSSAQQSQTVSPQPYQPPPKIQGGPQQPLSNAPSTEGSQNQLAKSQIQPLQMEAPRFNVPILNDENPSFKTINPQLLQSPASPPPAYQILPSSAQQSQTVSPQPYQPPPKFQGGPQQSFSNVPSTEGSQTQLAKSQNQPLQMEAPTTEQNSNKDGILKFPMGNPLLSLQGLLQSNSDSKPPPQSANPLPAYQNVPSTQQSQIFSSQLNQPPKIEGGSQQPLSNIPSIDGSKNQLTKSQNQPSQMEVPIIDIDENPKFPSVNPQLLLQSTVQPNSELKQPSPFQSLTNPLSQSGSVNQKNEENKPGPVASTSTVSSTPQSNLPETKPSAPNPILQILLNSTPNSDSSQKFSTPQPQLPSILNQSSQQSISDFLDENLSKSNSQLGPIGDIIPNDYTNSPPPPTTLSGSGLPDPGNAKSGLELQLENNFSQPQPNKHEPSNKSISNLDLDDSGILSDLAKYDKSFSVDIEDPKRAKEDHTDLLIYANSNDIHVPKLPPVPSANTVETGVPNNNNNLLNTSPTSAMRPNNNGDQLFNTNPNQLLSSLYFNGNQNPMFNNKIQTGMTNGFNNNRFDTNVDQKPMTPTINDDLQSSAAADNSGQIYKKIQLKAPAESISSYSLLPDNYQKKKRASQNIDNMIDNSQTINAASGTPSQYNNQGTPIIPSLDNIPSMMFAISNAVQLPLGGCKAIFDVTQANFPRIPLIQQIQLTHTIAQSIVVGLNKMHKIVINNSFGQRVKRDSIPFLPSVMPKPVVEPEPKFPVSGSLVNKNYRQSNPNPRSNSGCYQQPATDSNQQMYNSGTNLNTKSQDDMGFAQQSTNTQQYVTDILANEIKIAINSNLPAPYTKDSPEVKEYIRQVILTVGVFYHDQIVNVLQGRSPTMNI